MKKEKPGLGLYTQVPFVSGDEEAFNCLMEIWLVCSGTIKISVSKIKSGLNSNTVTVERLTFREFSSADHESYEQMYIHAMNYKNKIISNSEYLEEEMGNDLNGIDSDIEELKLANPYKVFDYSKRNCAKGSPIPLANINIDWEISTPGEIASALVKLDVPFDLVAKIRNRLKEVG